MTDADSEAGLDGHQLRDIAVHSQSETDRIETRHPSTHAADSGRLTVKADHAVAMQGNNWFSQGLIKPGRLVTAITYPGRRGIGHQWAYLPDVAETMVRLLEHAGMLEPFATFHMQGHWDADGTQMVDAIRKAVGNPNLKVRPTPWWLLRLLSPFVPLFRELAEMQYLWNVPVRMDNVRLTAALGAEPHTPLDLAVRKTLIGLGCLADKRASVS